MHLIKRLKRKNISIQGWCRNKQACWYAYVPRRKRSLHTVRKMHLIKRLKRKNISIQGWCHNKQACRYAYIPRSLNVSDNMVCLKRKKYQSREQASYRCIHRSLSVSDKMTRLKRKKIINWGVLPEQTSQIHIYTSFFKCERQYGGFKAKENINCGILPQQTSQICVYTSFFKRERQYDPFKTKEIIKVLWYCHLTLTVLTVYNSKMLLLKEFLQTKWPGWWHHCNHCDNV